MKSHTTFALFALALAACSASRPAPDPTPVATVGSARPSPCDALRCSSETRCEVTHGAASCVPIMRPNASFCGGIAGIRCPGNGRCVDSPDDDCDPAHGGRDCGGICQPGPSDGGTPPTSR